MDFLSASSVLSLKLGRVDVRFHEPVRGLKCKLHYLPQNIIGKKKSSKGIAINFEQNVAPLLTCLLS